MKKSRFSEQERLAIIAKQESGQSVDDICREHQISAATFYKWKKDVSDNQDEDKRRLKELELENKRLKKMYAELSIDHEILKEGYQMAKKLGAQKNKKSWLIIFIRDLVFVEFVLLWAFEELLIIAENKVVDQKKSILP